MQESDHPHPYPPPSRGRKLFGFTTIFPSPGGRGEEEGEKNSSVRATVLPKSLPELDADRIRRYVKGLPGRDTSGLFSSIRTQAFS